MMTQSEFIEIRNKLFEKNQLCLTLKHNLEDLTIEKKNLEEKYNNLRKLLDFYEEKAKKEEEDELDSEKKDKIKQLEMKIMKLNDKIKDLEEQIIKKDNDLEVVKQELEEEKEISQKAAEIINEKDEEIEQIKKNGVSKKGQNLSSERECDLTPEEIQALKEVFLSQQEEFDEYKEKNEKKIKEYTEENTKLQTELNEIKNKNSNMEIEMSRLKEKYERLENKKKVNKDFIEEEIENVYINEIRNLLKQLEEAQRKNQEMNGKQGENNYKKFEKIPGNILDSKEVLYKIIIEKDKELRELKLELSRYPIELKEGEKLMTVNFTTIDSKIQNYSIICKNTEIFNNLEKRLYEDYKEYYNTENYFTVNGKIIHKCKNLDENNVHNNDVIILNTIDI